MSIKKQLFKLITICTIATTVFAVPVLADAEKVVTIGQDLTAEEQAKMLKYFGVQEGDARIIYVSNQEERDLLSNYIPLSVIGTRTLSCAYVKPTNSGGIRVKTANLNWVTSNMLASALSTSGVKNCEVIAACPKEVSGTGALTGVLKAYETAADSVLSSEKKIIAAQEIATTSNIAETVGPTEATQIINEIKIKIIEDGVKDTEAVQNIVDEAVEDAIAEINAERDELIDITQEQKVQLEELAKKIAEQQYSYDDVKETLERVEKNVGQDVNVNVNVNNEFNPENTNTVENNTTVENNNTDTNTNSDVNNNNDTNNTTNNNTNENNDVLPEDSILLGTDDTALGDNVLIGSTDIEAIPLETTDEEVFSTWNETEDVFPTEETTEPQEPQESQEPQEAETPSDTETVTEQQPSEETQQDEFDEIQTSEWEEFPTEENTEETEFNETTEDTQTETQETTDENVSQENTENTENTEETETKEDEATQEETTDENTTEEEKTEDAEVELTAEVKDLTSYAFSVQLNKKIEEATGTVTFYAEGEEMGFEFELSEQNTVIITKDDKSTVFVMTDDFPEGHYLFDAEMAFDGEEWAYSDDINCFDGLTATKIDSTTDTYFIALKEGTLSEASMENATVSDDGYVVTVPENESIELTIEYDDGREPRTVEFAGMPVTDF